MNNQSVNEQVNDLMPKSLDDIVRQNRDKLRLELPTKSDLDSLKFAFQITNLQGVFTKGFIYKYLVPDTGHFLLFMIGHKVDGGIRHTSNLVGWDPETKVALTRSGSHYILEKFIDPDTDQTLLAGICAWSHLGPAGKYFGMPLWTF